MNTVDPALRSWVESANEPGAEFPIQTLPYCSFRRKGSKESPRIGVGIGDQMVELRKVIDAGVLPLIDLKVAEALSADDLTPLLRLGRVGWTQAREAIATMLRDDCPTLRDSTRWRKRAMLGIADAELLVPASIGDYTDFYASVHHATNVGSMFRPDNPLLPNWKHMPVGYHGRASSIVASGTPVRRPMGQTVKDDEGPPTFGPAKLLDYELEMGFLVGPGNASGTRIPIDEAANQIFGLVIVNDWSARDIQKWEYQPLGPFNAKNFATTISSWVIPMDALTPFTASAPKRPKGDPKPLDYLKWADDFSLDIKLEVLISSEKMRKKETPPMRVSTGNFKDLYWTMTQMIAHHTSTGCNLRGGDLLATGTISGADDDERGCLLERTWRGTKPIKLSDGSERKFLEDGDEVIMRAWCEKKGAVRVSFGECRGVVLPAE